ncbi:hypothetical protein Tco_0328936 [Tanacetum coccineum]
MGGLHAAIEDAISSSLFRGLFIGSQDLHISHVLYADDTLFFGEWNDQNINNLITGLGCFYTVSGLPINFQKSNLFGLRIQQSEVERLASGKGCSASFLPFTYPIPGLRTQGSQEAHMNQARVQLYEVDLMLQEKLDKCNSLVLSWILGQFDSLVDLPACTYACAPKLKEHSQLLRLMQFLMGLDDTYGPVKCLILTTEPLPDVKYAFATFSRDESHRQSHVNASTSRSGPSAFAAKHTIDRCYELVGYPSGFKKKGTSQSINNVNNVVLDKVDHSRGIPHTFTSDQYQRLMNLLSGLGESSNVQDNVLANTSPFVHPNGTVAQVMQIGNYKHFKNLIIKDALVVPSYHDLTERSLMGTAVIGVVYIFFDEVSLRSGSASLRDLEMQITQTLDLANIYGRKRFYDEEETRFKSMALAADDSLWEKSCSEVMTLTYQDHSPKERFGLGTMKHTKPKTRESSKNNVSGLVTVSDTEPVTSLVPTKVKNNDQESKIDELKKLVQMLMDEKINSTQKIQEPKFVSSQPESSKFVNSSKQSQDSKPNGKNPDSSKPVRPKTSSKTQAQMSEEELLLNPPSQVNPPYE